MSLAPAALAALFPALTWAVASLLFGRLLSEPREALRPTAGGATLFKNLLGALVFGLIWLFAGGAVPAASELPLVLVSGFLGFALGDALYFAAMPRCGVQAAAMTGQLNVPFAALIAWLALGQALEPAMLLAMAVVLAGILLVVSDAPPGARVRDPRQRRRGLVLAALAALSQASGVVAGHAGLREVGVVPGAALRLAAAVAGGFGLALLAGLAPRRASGGAPSRSVAGEVRDLVRPLRSAVLARALMPAAVFGTVLGLLPFHYALRELPSGIAAVLFSTTPLFTLPLGVALGERHGWRAVVGTLVGFAGIVGVVSTLPEAPLRAPVATPLALASGSDARWPRPVPAPGGGFGLSWIEGGEGGEARLLLARADASGSFGAPRVVAAGDDWFLNWADFPAVALGEESALAAWLERSGEGTYAYGVRRALARDPDAAWSRAAWLHDDASATEHGFVSLVALEGDAFAAAWLDGRATAEGGPMQLRARFVAADGAAGPEIMVDERVCDCCPTAAVRTGDGALVVAWRDRTEDEVRDIAFARGDPRDPGSWSAARLVHADGWRIAGCPVNGPALDARGDVVALAWFSAAGDEPRAALALSRDGGRTFGAPVVFARERCFGRVDVALLSEDAALVTWLEADEGGGAWMARTIEDGRLGPSVVLAAATGTRADGMLRLARSGDRVLAAWTDAAAGGVRLARVARR